MSNILPSLWVWHCFMQNSVNWGQGHGLTPPMEASFFEFCDQSQTWQPSLVSTYEYEIATLGRGKNVGLLLVPSQKGHSLMSCWFHLKKRRRRRRQEPLHLMWCYICHFLFYWKNYLLKLDVCIVSIYYPGNLSFSVLKLWVWSKNDSVSASSQPCYCSDLVDSAGAEEQRVMWVVMRSKACRGRVWLMPWETAARGGRSVWPLQATWPCCVIHRLMQGCSPAYPQSCPPVSCQSG